MMKRRVATLFAAHELCLCGGVSYVGQLDPQWFRSCLEIDRERQLARANFEWQRQLDRGVDLLAIDPDEEAISLIEHHSDRPGGEVRPNLVSRTADRVPPRTADF